MIKLFWGLIKRAHLIKYYQIFKAWNIFSNCKAIRLHKIENKENFGFIDMIQHSYKTILMGWFLKVSKTIELVPDLFQIDIYHGHKRIKWTA